MKKIFKKKNYDTDIGVLKSELFIDFIFKKISPCYYSKTLSVSIALIKERIENFYYLMKEKIVHV
ncbi:MAG: DUF2164 family protein [Endomicrobium sp.]|nr:DUF2164 family protein [Endomicrobium sp.]